MRFHGASRQAFTLIEMALVMVIVALIIAAILGTRSMIRTSQIQAVMGEYQAYTSAVKNFRAKFHELPGDFSGATALWGASANCPIGPTAAAGTQTCNGDGDGLIEFDAVPNYEHLGAWRHLALAGFINQNFTGNSFGSSSCDIDIKGGVTSPVSKLKAAVWNIGINRMGTVYSSGNAGSAGDIDDQYFPMSNCKNGDTQHALWLGGSLQNDDGQAASCSHSQIPVFTGQEAYDIDQKFDDKRAKSGKIRNQYNNTASYEACEDAASTYGGYKTNATGMNCSLAFLIDP